jgi:16S rRNA G1207 methylase RsmC
MFSSYRLLRVPQDSSLKAWNAADELFLQRLDNESLGATLIINDSFGALSIALNDSKALHWNDSAMSLEAIAKNTELNELKTLEPFNATKPDQLFNTIVINLPKSLNYFSWLLEHASSLLAPNGKISVLSMVKHISSGHIKIMDALFNEVNPGRAEKKARVITLQSPTYVSQSQPTRYSAEPININLENLPGCYAANSLDQGARAFLKHFDFSAAHGNVLDMGCGNGVLSLAILQKNKDVNITLVDESLPALNSALLNVKTFSEDVNAQFFHSNGMNSVPDNKYDLIICNPPFHQGNTVTESISNKLFTDFSQCLADSGTCWIIANRHLNYHADLKKKFSSVKRASQDSKFILYKCQN